MAAAVEAARAQIADGSLGGFSDKDELRRITSSGRTAAQRDLAGLPDGLVPTGLDRLTPADRAALTNELFAWVSDGPPRTSGQDLVGVQLSEDQLPSGISATYFVDEQVSYVGVVRVQRR